MEIRRATVKHKPARTIKVKRRVYEDIVADYRRLQAREVELAEDCARYAGTLHHVVSRLNGEHQDLLSEVKEQTPELWADES